MCRTKHDKDDDDDSSSSSDDDSDSDSDDNNSSGDDDEHKDGDDDDEAESGKKKKRRSHDDGVKVKKEKNDDKDPVIFTKEFPHFGVVNRIRAMKQNAGIIAVWGEEGYMSIFDARDLYLQLCDPQAWLKETIASGTGLPKKQLVKKPLFQSGKSQHATEGFALEWSPRVEGLLASGDNHGKIFVWQKNQQSTDFTGTMLKGHSKSVEDIQWSPTQDNVLASCSVDTTIRVWDIRDGKSPQKLQWQADVSDINVISWNTNPSARQFLASGSDTGVFKIWDLRMVKKEEVVPVSEFPFHQEAISTIEWSPLCDSLIAVGSDTMVTFWDLSVEHDEDENKKQQMKKSCTEIIPPQLLFIHQGVECAKEFHWHSQIPGLGIVSDAAGFQFFKPINWKTLIK